jgi:hypothetical protein
VTRASSSWSSSFRIALGSACECTKHHHPYDVFKGWHGRQKIQQDSDLTVAGPIVPSLGPTPSVNFKETFFQLDRQLGEQRNRASTIAPEIVE